MRFHARAIQRVVREAARAFPAVVVTGPRRAGKTTLLRRLFRKHNTCCSKTLQPFMARPLQALLGSAGGASRVRAAIVHPVSKIAPAVRTVAPGVESLDVEQFVAALGGASQ